MAFLLFVQGDIKSNKGRRSKEHKVLLKHPVLLVLQSARCMQVAKDKILLFAGKALCSHSYLLFLLGGPESSCDLVHFPCSVLLYSWPQSYKILVSLIGLEQCVLTSYWFREAKLRQ